MFNESEPWRYWRSLLTETLPYEVPVIFSNEIFYASLVKPSGDPAVRKIVDGLRSLPNKYTIPYSYKISKDEERTTTLGIIHPYTQRELCEFYELYKQSLIDYCSTADISLRRPTAVLPFFSESEIAKDKPLKLGIPHIQPGDGEIDVSRMTSYFTYQKFTLLGKFVEAKEFRDLEKKFRLLRTLDVSKCFFHIYTHSVTWAIKGKEFSKPQGDTYSFEARFDKLMQLANYNETNGIVIGPEVSRIFAEIILQDVDRKIISDMLPLVHGVDYAVRRYVDDYFVFSSTEIVLGKITEILKSRLEQYKLFLNTAKTQTFERPFVSQISLARNELKGVTSSIAACIDAVVENADAKSIKRQERELKKLAGQIRLISERYKVGFNALSGWLLATLRTLVGRGVSAIKSAPDDDVSQALTDVVMALVETAFHSVALDLRVRPTYFLCQMATMIEWLNMPQYSDSYDLISHRFREELSEFIMALLRQQEGLTSANIVELSNLMITGAHCYGAEFLKAEGPRAALTGILDDPELSYFEFVTAKFCMLKDQVAYAAELDAINVRVRSKVLGRKAELGVNAELYLLMCDYLNSPDILGGEKRTLVVDICGGEPSTASVEEAAKYMGFVDWKGMRVEHVLARRELRPVYSWS